MWTLYVYTLQSSSLVIDLRHWLLFAIFVSRSQKLSVTCLAILTKVTAFTFTRQILIGRIRMVEVLIVSHWARLWHEIVRSPSMALYIALSGKWLLPCGRRLLFGYVTTLPVSRAVVCVKLFLKCTVRVIWQAKAVPLGSHSPRIWDHDSRLIAFCSNWN